MTATNMFFISRKPVTSKLTDSRLEFRIRTKAISLAGGIRAEAICDAEEILDPFLGIGNSAIAAQRCGVKKFIGFEIDQTYLAEARRRIG